MITKLEILIMSDNLPTEYQSGAYPQIMSAAFPDMTPEQWMAFGWALIDNYRNEKVSNINADELEMDAMPVKIIKPHKKGE